MGRIDTWKGVDVLLDSVPLMGPRAGGPAGALQLVVAGGPVEGKEAYAGSLRHQAQDLGVLWLGPLSGTAAGDLIADLDCLVLPSTEPEPWGLVLVEALACGTPVVATGAGGAGEIVVGLPTGAGRLGPAPGRGRAGHRGRRAAPVSDQHGAASGPGAVLRAGEPGPSVEIFSQVVDPLVSTRLHADSRKVDQARATNPPSGPFFDASSSPGTTFARIP